MQNYTNENRTERNTRLLKNTMKAVRLTCAGNSRDARSECLHQSRNATLFVTRSLGFSRLQRRLVNLRLINKITFKSATKITIHCLCKKILTNLKYKGLTKELKKNGIISHLVPNPCISCLWCFTVLRRIIMNNSSQTEFSLYP